MNGIENLIVDKYLLNVPYPILDIIKGFLICDVIDKHDSLQRNNNTYYEQHNARTTIPTSSCVISSIKPQLYHCSSVVGCCDCPEAFLTCCIPKKNNSETMIWPHRGGGQINNNICQ